MFCAVISHLNPKSVFMGTMVDFVTGVSPIPGNRLQPSLPTS